MILDKNTRYIYRVAYGQKSHTETHDVIKHIFYLNWDHYLNGFREAQSNAENFKIGLHNNNFEAKAGVRVNNNFKDLVDVTTFEQQDGEIWLKTKPDHTKENNLESLLEYAKFYGFAERENTVSEFR